MEKHSDKQPENNEESLLLQQPQQQQLQILQQLQQLNENLLRQQQLQGQEAVEIQQQDRGTPVQHMLLYQDGTYDVLNSVRGNAGPIRRTW